MIHTSPTLCPQGVCVCVDALGGTEPLVVAVHTPCALAYTHGLHLCAHGCQMPALTALMHAWPRRWWCLGGAHTSTCTTWARRALSACWGRRAARRTAWRHLRSHPGATHWGLSPTA